jgi:septum formation protein
VSRLVLGSTSPRRRELLGDAGYEFDVVASPAPEIMSGPLTVREMAAWNALRKGWAVARLRPRAVVLAADTLVALEDEIIGKPRDLDHAFEILRRLSGRAHLVCTAVFICDASTGRSRSLHEISQVTFKKLSEATIRDYFSKIDPLDKAGAYAAQGHGREIIERIEGSFTNVVGLPMEQTADALAHFGVRPRRA